MERDGTITTVNNPSRVHPLLDAIDQPQAGLPRVIHPIGMRVGQPDTGVIIVETHEGYIDIKEDATYVNDAGDPFFFPAGHKLSPAEASRFPDLVKQVDGGLIVVAVSARPEGEVPDLAPTELARRGLPSAPENRMEPAPENRSRAASKKD